MGNSEFVCELRDRDEPGATGGDDAVFLVRPNTSLPFAPVAETASGGEFSRIALAIAAVAGGDTLVFDEIDAGIGGETAHAVGPPAPAARRAGAGRDDYVLPADRPHSPTATSASRRTPGDPTHTRIEQLSDEGVETELERMLGGEEFLAAVRG